MAGVADDKPHYSFLSSPAQSRVWASRGVPPPIRSPLSSSSHKLRPITAFSVSQRVDIRPATDWTYLMSGPQKGGQKRLVQRPWPDYVPESSAPVGRHWGEFGLSKIGEDRNGRMPTSHRRTPFRNQPSLAPIGKVTPMKRLDESF